MVVRGYSNVIHRDGTRLQEPRVVETILSRYRNLLVLALVVVSQLLLLAWQVRTNQDVRLIRVWAVTAVTPMAGVIEAVRRNTIGFLEDYFILLDVRDQNRKLRQENGRLKLENVYFRNELQTADRARVLSNFQQETPSRTVAARIIGNGTASSAQVVFLDRGSTSGIENGMAVVTPDGIVGKVIAVYPLASQVLLVTDSTFAVGVESQKGHIHGTLHCSPACTVDYVQNEENIGQGEWFYTSGEDRIFPKGFPVGTVSSAKQGQFMKDIHLNLNGTPGSADEVLVILEGVHQQIPTVAPPQQRMAKTLPPPPPDNLADQQKPKMATQADKVKDRYLEIGKQQNHQYGAIGSGIPNFNSTLPASSAGTGSGTAAAPPKPQPPTVAAITPGSRPSQPSRPAILGARPQTHPSAAGTKPAVQHKTTGPVLPLGAPRHKAAAPAASHPQQ